MSGRSDLAIRVAIVELADAPADITKIVWTARTIRDNLEAVTYTWLTTVVGRVSLDITVPGHDVVGYGFTLASP